MQQIPNNAVKALAITVANSHMGKLYKRPIAFGVAASSHQMAISWRTGASCGVLRQPVEVFRQPEVRAFPGVSGVSDVTDQSGHWRYAFDTQDL